MTVLRLSLGDAVGHAVAIAHARVEEPDVELRIEPGAFVRLEREGELVSDDPIAIAERLAPELFPEDFEHDGWVEFVVSALIEGAETVGASGEQAAYEHAYAAWKAAVDRAEARLEGRRYLLGERQTFADVLLFAFAARLDGVYHVLLKANPYLLDDLPSLHAFARDLYELPEVHTRTDWDALLREPHGRWSELNPRGLVPAGGRPDLDAPHFRDELGEGQGEVVDAAVEEDPSARRASGEWVRGRSRHRRWAGSQGHPLEAGRYHLFAPFNCPWSHRALLGRAVKGLQDAVGVSILYFRRDPDRGWQFNPAIPGCTEDRVHGRKYIAEYYEAEGSSERSVPVLYDVEAERIVNNESAEILRMFDQVFGPLADRDIDLYPRPHRAQIDRINRHVYQRINNGAYKAGFASSQHAYERAFARYFAALRWIEGLLEGKRFLVGTEHPTEADLRLFPTIFRHDVVYYARFRLDGARIRDFPRLAAWLERMRQWPGVAEASDLDHARNGYFGRHGNEIVPAGPVPLGLSPKDFSRDVWLGDGRAR